MKWWQNNRMRMIQNNLRDIDGDMDVDALVAELKSYRCNTVMVGASGIKLLKFLLSGVGITSMEIAVLLVGCVVSFIVSLLVIKGLMEYVRKHSFSAFGVYRIILGAIVLVYFVMK